MTMHIRKAQLAHDVLNTYRNKTLSEISSIKVLWACGINEKHSLNTGRHLSDGYQLFYVDIKELVNLSEFGEMGHARLNPHQLFSGIDGQDLRIARILDHWNKGGYIDPPEIYFSNSQKLGFSDGRHRTIAAFHLGVEKIPVIMHLSSIDKVSGLLL